MRNALRLFFNVFELALYIIWCNFAKSNPTQKDIEYHSIFRLAICLGRWMAITVYICMCFLYTYKYCSISAFLSSKPRLYANIFVTLHPDKPYII